MRSRHEKVSYWWQIILDHDIDRTIKALLMIIISVVKFNAANFKLPTSCAADESAMIISGYSTNAIRTYIQPKPVRFPIHVIAWHENTSRNGLVSSNRRDAINKNACQGTAIWTDYHTMTMSLSQRISLARVR
jgi:hypothetical protein